MSSLSKNKISALLVTLLFHGGLFLLLMLTMLTTPDPPLSGGEGMVVNLGYVDESTGEIQPMSETTTETPSPVPENQEPQLQEQENVVTQDIEETEKIAVTENPKPTVKEAVVKAIVEQPKVIEEKKADPRALFKGKNNGSTSQGTSDKGAGDQGSRDGDINSKNYGPGGTGGLGGPGEKGGKGDPNYSLGNRQALSKAKVKNDCQQTGKVVVEIKVDRNGNVVKATPGVRGTTNTAPCLMEKAEQAAIKTKWEADPSAPELQIGKITYNFLLN